MKDFFNKLVIVVSLIVSMCCCYLIGRAHEMQDHARWLRQMREERIYHTTGARNAAP